MTMIKGINELCLEITGACPMACVHCSSFNMGDNRFDMSKLMSPDKVEKTISDFAALGGEVLEISGGEPLLHPNLGDFIEFAKAQGIEVRLYTSGLVGLYRREISPISRELAKELRGRGLDKVLFNLQGAMAETHERITKTPGSFSIVQQSIRNSKAESLWVGVHFVPMKPNYKELYDVIFLCKDLGVDRFGILRFVPQGRGKFYQHELELSPGEMRELAHSIADARRSLGPGFPALRTGSPMNFLRIADEFYQPVACIAARTTCTVMADGNVVPCSALKQVPGFSAGNINRTSLLQIWGESAVFQQFRELGREELVGECPAQRIIKGEKVGNCCGSTGESPATISNVSILQVSHPA